MADKRVNNMILSDVSQINWLLYQTFWILKQAQDFHKRCKHLKVTLTGENLQKVSCFDNTPT